MVLILFLAMGLMATAVTVSQTVTATPAPRGHSALAPSKAHRWMRCPGSVRLCRDIPDEEQSEYAAEGSHAHHFAQYCLMGNLWDAKAHIGMVFQDWTVTANMAEAVQVYLDTIRADLAEHPTAKLSVEGHCDARYIHKDLWGSFDAMLVIPNEWAIVYDYKHGQGVVVEVVDNEQLEVYAMDPFMRHDVETVRVVIVQPRAPHSEGPVRSITYSLTQLKDIAHKLADGARKTDAPDAPLIAGEHCHWCPAASTCPQLRERSLAVAEVDLVEQGGTPGAPHTLTDLQLVRALRAVPMVKAWAAAVTAYAYKQAIAGKPPLDHKLVLGRKGNRKWSDEAKALDALQFLGVEPYDKKLRSPADIEKELGKKDTKGLQELITQSPGSPELVEISDPRPAISSSAENDFQAIA